MIRVRFAPSPTGNLHIGGVRTALFNYLYARAQKGQFLVRIEDTDKERSKPEFEKEILTSMEFLGLKLDEEIIRQSSRIERYREVAKTLVDKDMAYEETSDGRTALKFRMPKKETKLYDLVRGEVSFDTSLFDDLVIFKSDGFPTYHFACVVDDHDMQISHVIRGDDHLSNTPRQVLLYEAMGWKPPKYAHLPLIIGDDGTPLSKRHGVVALKTFMAKGYLPEAMLNYLALLGWGDAGGNQEFFTLEQLIKKFSIKRVNKASARFNIEKLNWLNGEHLKAMSEEAYLKGISDFYPELSKRFSAKAWKGLLLLYRSRIKTYGDLKDQAPYCFEDITHYDQGTREKLLKNSVADVLEKWQVQAEQADFENHQSLEKLTRDLAEESSLKAADLIHPLRFAICSKTVSPSLFELMSVLGKTTTLERLHQFLTKG